MFRLREYQQDCLDAVRFAHEAHESVIVELATGCGKTVVFTKYASHWSNGRVLVVCPMLSIIGQTCRKILKETGIMPAVEQADQWSNEADWARSPYIVASKDTLCSGKHEPRYKRFRDVGLVIFDEAHLAATQLNADMLQHFRSQGAKILGVTATAKRHDKRAMGQLFDHCAFQYGILDAINDGWLVDVRVTCLQLKKLDLSKVETAYTPQGPDFNQKQLCENLENPEVIYEIAEAVNNETRGKKTVVYCASVNEAQAVAELLKDQYRINADWICADEKRCSAHRRHNILESFTTQDDGISHVCNVGILTTGWDYPGLECIVNARPTKSLPLYSQILGRVTRPVEEDGRPVCDHDGCDTPALRQAAINASRKPYGRMIDLVDNSLKHKIRTAIDVLGGLWTLEEQEAVLKHMLDKPGACVLSEERKAELARQAEERRRQEEEALRRQRASHVVRNAEFYKQDVNPFGGSAVNTGHARGSQKIPPTPKQIRCLYAMGWRSVDQFDLTKSQASRAIGQLKSGVRPEELQRMYRKKVRITTLPLST